MQIVGFNLTKAFIERKEDIKGKFKVNSRIEFKDLKEEKITLIEGKTALKFDFEYNIEYEPKLAELNFKGFVLAVSEPKAAKETLEEWKKKKSINPELKIKLLNLIFHKCNVKALGLEEDFNLPPHLRLPYITPKAEKSDSTYTG